MKPVWTIVLGLSLVSCGDDETAACTEGFEKKNGRWCVYTEAPLVVIDDAGETPEDTPNTPPEDTPAEPTQPDPPIEDPVDDPTDYVHDIETVAPALSLSQIEAGIAEAIWTVQSIDPAPLHAVYLGAQTNGAATPTELSSLEDTGDIYAARGCPAYDWDYYWENKRDYWRDACTVSEGGSFSGYAYSYDHGSYTDWSDTYNYAGYAYYSGSAKVVDGFGHTFIGAGSSSYYERERTSTLDWTYSQSVNGNFRTDNPLYADTWLAKDINVSLYLYATKVAETGAVYVDLSASISGLEGTVNAVRFEETLLYSESLGSMCELEPSGKISLRGPEGNWYEAEFHGPKYSGAGAFPPDCDSCGPVYFRGQLLGEVCPDFSGLREWDRPWR